VSYGSVRVCTPGEADGCMCALSEADVTRGPSPILAPAFAVGKPHLVVVAVQGASSAPVSYLPLDCGGNSAADLRQTSWALLSLAAGDFSLTRRKKKKGIFLKKRVIYGR
jgi:hypothetical protein